MGRGTWSWIVPDGLWEIAEPLIPPSKVRPQGGGTQDTPDETLFAAIIYVLVSGCAWRALPPCFGISKYFDINSRRGQIEGMESRGTTQVVRAFVPLAQMFGYVTDLRSMSQGRATSSMEFSHYAEVPGNLASELVQKSKV